MLHFAGTIRSVLGGAETTVPGSVQLARVAFAGAVVGAAGIATAIVMVGRRTAHEHLLSIHSFGDLLRSRSTPQDRAEAAGTLAGETFAHLPHGGGNLGYRALAAGLLLLSGTVDYDRLIRAGGVRPGFCGLGLSRASYSAGGQSLRIDAAPARAAARSGRSETESPPVVASQDVSRWSLVAGGSILALAGVNALIHRRRTCACLPAAGASQPLGATSDGWLPSVITCRRTITTPSRARQWSMPASRGGRLGPKAGSALA